MITTDDPHAPAEASGRGNERDTHPPRSKKRIVNGWLVFDKPVGMTSTHAVALAKRALSAKKAGHAGTLDPLASGILPIALGEATKTVPYVMDGTKSYVFTVQWGTETDTDDAEGRPVQTSEERPSREAVEALLPGLTGAIEQVPPRFSAVKIAGERAYDLARDGETVELAARTVQVDRLAVLEHDGHSTVLAADCGKGTYVRALARDLGRQLGCLGHVTALRRTRVGPFAENASLSLSGLEEAGRQDRMPALQPVAAALADLPAVAISGDGARRVMRGQPVLLRGRDAPVGGRVQATCNGALLAVGDIEAGEFMPHRVFTL